MMSMTSSAPGRCVRSRFSSSWAFCRGSTLSVLWSKPMTASYAAMAVRRKPLPFSSTASAPKPPTVEENVPWTKSSTRTGRSVGRCELVEGLEAPPRRDLRVGQVDQPRLDVLLHLLDGLLEQRRRREAEDQCLRRARGRRRRAGPRRAVVGASARLAGRGWTSISKRAVRGPGVERLGALRRVHRQVPGVDAVALEQHDGVLAGGHVDLEPHLAGAVADRPVEVLGCARGARSTRSTRRGRSARALRRARRCRRRPLGSPAAPGPCAGRPAGGVRRRRGDADRAPANVVGGMRSSLLGSTGASPT